LLSFDEFFGEEKFNWLPSKNKTAVVVAEAHKDSRQITMLSSFHQPLCY
jgi:hypothetical protein